MCTNCRYIYNHFSRKSVLVRCGHCDACKQEAAAKRAVRIRNNVTDGTIALFVTLTYSNNYVPYVLRSDLESNDFEINVYRNADVRYIYDRHSDLTRLKYDFGTHPIARTYVPLLVRSTADEVPNKYRTSSLPSLKGLGYNYIGVPYYPDIQEFYKRLRSYLERDYHYEKSFSYFTCSELGGHTYRPHFHALIFIPRAYESIFRSAVVKAWPYADRRRTAKFIEIARDAASYVSSYVNSGSNLPALFEEDMFKQKHSSSKDFGVVLDCFSLTKILEKIDSGDLAYYCRKKFDGRTDVHRLPIPKYVLYRYFPVCKGFSWLDSCQLRSILLDPQRVGDILTDFSYVATLSCDVYDYSYFSHSFDCDLHLLHCTPVDRQCKLINPVYHYTPLETYKIYVRLENCYQRFHSETGLSRFDYAYYYERVWSLYSSMLLKMMHEDLLENHLDYSEFYENGFEIIDRPDIAPTLSNLTWIQPDPNKRTDIVVKTDNLRSLYSRMCKQRCVTNYVMASSGYDV